MSGNSGMFFVFALIFSYSFAIEMLQTKVRFIDAYSAHTMYCDLTGDVTWWKTQPQIHKFSCDRLLRGHCLFDHINEYHRLNHYGHFYCINGTHIMNYELILVFGPECTRFSKYITICNFWSRGNWIAFRAQNKRINECEIFFPKDGYNGTLYDVDDTRSYSCSI